MQRIAQILGNMNGGGVEQTVLNYYHAIDRSEIQFDFFIFENSTLVPYEEITSLGGSITEFPRFKHPFRYVSALKKALKHGNCKIVHCHLSTLSFLPLLAAKLAGVPVRIVHNHSTSGGKRERLRNLAKTVLKPFAALFATNYMACSEYAAEWMYGKRKKAALAGGVSADDVVVMRNAIDVEKFSFDESKRREIRDEFGIADEVTVYGHVGRFCPQKNQSFLLEIFAEIQKRQPNSILMLVGTGDDMELIKTQCSALGLSEKVIFTGQRKDTDKLYCGFDCFVMPSNYEGLPVVGVEAQCSGVSCLFSDKITAEVIMCDNAQIVPLSATAIQWAEAALKKYQHRNNDAVEQVRNKGYDIHHQADGLKEFYNHC